MALIQTEEEMSQQARDVIVEVKKNFLAMPLTQVSLALFGERERELLDVMMPALIVMGMKAGVELATKLSDKERQLQKEATQLQS